MHIWLCRLPTAECQPCSRDTANSQDVSHLEVYKEFAIRYLQQTGNLDILSFVVQGPEDDLDPRSIPTWTPRWDRGSKPVSWFNLNHRKITSPHRDSSTGDVVILTDSSSIRVRGVVIDFVRHVSKVPQYMSATAESAKEIVSLWMEVASEWKKHDGPHQDRLGIAFISMICKGKRPGTLYQRLRSLRVFAQRLESDQPFLADNDDENCEATRQLACYSMGYLRERRLILTGRGHSGLAPCHARNGEVCAIIFGARLPFILRRVHEQEHYFTVIGPAYTQSQNCTDAGVPYRLGQDNDCEDWTAWGLPTEDILLH